MITEPEQAEQIIEKAQADAIFMARAFLFDPYWPMKAAIALGDDPNWPPQYARVHRPGRRDAAPARSSTTDRTPGAARRS
jgi:2,4-dienoyl-CoA reductase-like NADH-dependent reductase (Old Yellow Enzyme family)